MKTYARIGLRVVLFFIGISSISCQNLPTDIELENSIDEIFATFDAIDKPGAAVAVTKNGVVVFKKGYGSANLEYDIPVTPKTIFHVASVSKQFTVFALLLLVEEGKLSLDDPIQKYISEVPDFGEKITLRHLATHTSGMRDQWDLLNLAGWRWDDVITKEHVLKLVAKQKELNFSPGEEYTYCNTGFTLLAEVVARVSGKTFAEFTQERMFIPLKMINSQFYDDHTKIVKNRAYSYYPANNGYVKSVLSYANVGATSLFTTVEDLSLWAMNFKKLKVGNEAIVEQMNMLAVLNNGENFGGAYGQFVGLYKGLKQIQHSGGDAGYRSYLSRFPDQEVAVSVVSNSGSSNPGRLASQVADLFLKDQFVIAEEDKQTGKTTIQLSTNQLKAFVGYFWDDKGSYSRRIHLKNGNLLYDRGNGNVTELAPIAEKKFLMLNVPSHVTVTFTLEDGQERMLVHENDKVIATLDAYDRSEVSKEDMKQYLGGYFSDELTTRYTIIENKGKLVATHPRSSDLPLEFLKKDVYRAGGTIIKFTRGSTKEITGLKATTGRVRNLKFSKD